MRMSKNGVDFFDVDDSDDSIEAAKQKGYKPYVQMTKNGKDVFDVEFSEDSYKAATDKGYKDLDAYNFTKDVGKPTKIDSGFRGMIDGMSAGYSDELGGAVEAVGSLAGVRGLGGSLSDIRWATPEDSQQSFGDIYKSARDSRREQSRIASDTNPGSYLTGDVAGSIATGALTGGASGLKGALALGGVDGLGRSDADNIKDAAVDTAVGVGLAGAGYGAVKSIGYAGGKAKDALGWTGKKAGRVLTGVPEDAAEHYLKNPDAVNHAKSLPELKDFIDEDVSKITQIVDENKKNVNLLKEMVSETKVESQLARAQLKDEAKDAYRATKESLSKTRPPENLAPEILDHLDSSSKDLSKLSTETFEILIEEGRSFNVQDLSKAIAKQAKDLEISGVAPKIGPDAQAYKALNTLNAYVNEIGSQAEGRISASDLKSVIQTIDSTSKAAYSNAAGELAPEAAERLASVRHSFDEVLKNSSPAYKQKMSELAPKAGLVSNMSKVFGTQQKAMGALNVMADPRSPKGRYARKLLEQYDEQHGTKFLTQMDEYFKAQNTLKSPTSMEALKNNLPEYKRLARELPEEAAYKEYGTWLEAAEKDLDAAKLWAEDVSKLGPNSTENVIKSVKGHRNLEAQKQLDMLGQVTGKNYEEMIRNSAVKDAFSKDSTQGSRKTLLGTVAGGFLGSSIGNPILGSAAGAGVGNIMDKYGGMIYKKILDGTLKVGKYEKFLKKLYGERGPAEMAIAIRVLMNSDPDFRKYFIED